MGQQPIRRALSLDLFGGFAESQCLRLGEYVGEKYVVVPADRVESLGERDEVARDQPRALMDELIKGVLAVRPRLAPVDWRRLVVDVGPVDGDGFAVALHRQLLQICRKALKVLLVRENRDGRRAKEVVVPQA